MRVGSLFSGIGGIEIGLERAGGFRTEWFVEFDPYAQAVLRKNFPGAVVYGDITQIDFSTVPPVDVLTGRFPCQDISNAGKRAGITGSRSSLWKCYAEAIRVLRPKYVIAENVSALIDRGLDVVLSDLASLGYDAEWHCIPAAAVGAPHRRDRIFIVAYPDSSGCFHGQAQEFPDQGGEYAQRDTRQSSTNVAYADKERLSSSETLRELEWQRPSESGLSTRGQWSVEPGVGRVAHGVPSRVDRIKCLGNAVVPQVAQVIGSAIIEAERCKQ